MIADSKEALAEAKQVLDDSWNKHKYVRMTLVEGSHRSLPQNDMDFHLYQHIGKQLYGGDEEHARWECKLDIGIPILCRDSEEFCSMWNKTFGTLGYEEQFAAMKVINVTSIMTRPQNAEFINLVIDRYAMAGVVWPAYIIKSARNYLQKHGRAA